MNPNIDQATGLPMHMWSAQSDPTFQEKRRLQRERRLKQLNKLGKEQQVSVPHIAPKKE